MFFYSRISSENKTKYGYIKYPLIITKLNIEEEKTIYYLYLNEIWEAGEFIKIPIAYEENYKKTILFKLNKPLLNFTTKEEQENFESQLEIDFENFILKY